MSGLVAIAGLVATGFFFLLSAAFLAASIASLEGPLKLKLPGLPEKYLTRPPV